MGERCIEARIEPRKGGAINGQPGEIREGS